MEDLTPISASLGGLLIGAAAVWLMASLGRIAGISGIAGGLLDTVRGDRAWRVAFLLGLVAAPLLLALWDRTLLDVEYPLTGWPLSMAGLLVGVGTAMGNGCTSGHGVCGNARFSRRSVVATFTFMAAGIATVAIRGIF